MVVVHWPRMDLSSLREIGDIQGRTQSIAGPAKLLSIEIDPDAPEHAEACSKHASIFVTLFG